MNKKLDFETSLQELEHIVTRLESGETSLEESISLFEKGVMLSSACRKTLETARQKILSITEAEGENETDE